MKLSQALKHYDLIVENGPLGTRLKYDYGYTGNDFSKDSPGRKILTELYKGDIAIAREYNTPIIINAATFRTSRNHLATNGLIDFEQIKKINLNNLQVIIDLKEEVKSDVTVILGAPLGSMFDAYSVENKPSVEEAYNYHKEQITLFKSIPVDFINVVTLPTLSEATGIAQACDESGMEYTIGFILGIDGKLLDGTTLNDAIAEIDSRTNRKPLGYLVTCTHSSVIELLESNSKNMDRLMGLQANGSCLSPTELAKLNKPVADDPEQFSQELKELKDKLNLKILGGCCGTTKEHLSHIIQASQYESRFVLS
ncbi:homocysteine S-methyltransferase family protein [Legionella jamestowniensis]|uniref:Bifunctional homocysteine S-methyltransferase/5,10-methylenetetrahydrofolate reductase protein n=1 Tax=Legionella jamestowniensis TaxID=455 RepID=A0A0W0UZV8_9GAMM|nr:homocysteine S-methyltransferase family protein [Legionella jamestowniensis]KTD13213.1 bifunctional homocysteine S-methyltransferase/5,10-methylenetetrahydrofolate reductase protein [Legionella jamestowniensis]SFL78620.1 Homocysteine/selenocysteine methylase (S-methylmethionine-dependent) [Legionella jamestowniensis DSM 19215]